MPDETLIRAATAADLPAIAALIAELNVQPEQHCVHCSETLEAINAGLAELGRGPELPPERFFVVATQNEQLVGTLGCEVDDALARAWLWGPFVRDEPWMSVAARMLAAFRAQLPPSVRRLDGFTDVQNVRAHRLLLDAGFAEAGSSHVYVARRDAALSLAQALCPPIIPEQHAAFVALHDATFPGTYYSGAAMLEQIDEQHQLFVAGNGSTVHGYLFVGIEDDPDEAYIHFVGVDPAQRGKGIGRRLLQTALHWGFVVQDLPQVGLTVDDERNVAQRLYASTGFRLHFTGLHERLIQE